MNIMTDLATQSFIKNAIEVHGDRYDYSKSKYINCDTKVIIICKEHGEFQQIPYNHINKKANCNKCSKAKRGLTQRKTTESFIIEAQEIHKNRFDYEPTKYKTSKDAVIIICKEHGEFTTLPLAHLKNKGGGCKNCAKISFKNTMSFTNEEFIKKSTEVHDTLYDYTKVDYKSSFEKVIIICKIHGEFKQTPANHWKGKGCRNCANELNGLNQRKDYSDFIEEAKNIHKDLYDYSLVTYSTCRENVIIICKIHGEFNQTPSSHLNGGGCKKCATNRTAESQRFTLEEFIEKANMVHQNKYVYDKSVYINSQTSITIECKIHGEFQQAPNSHLQGYGCIKCSSEIYSNCKRYTSEDIIKRAMEIHGDTFDYSKINFQTINDKITIICKIHGDFDQLVNNHIRFKHGCPKCAGYYVDTKTFIANAIEIHGELYDYSKVIYNKHNKNVEIICKIHGSFLQTPNTHLNGSGCTKCYKKYSKAQIKWLTILENELKIKIDHAENIGEHRIKESKYKADGYSNELNIIFEFHGCFWHGCLKCFPNRNEINKCTNVSYEELYNKTCKKEKYCIEMGYKVITVWECDWNEIYKNDDLIINYLESIKQKYFC